MSGTKEERNDSLEMKVNPVHGFKQIMDQSRKRLSRIFYGLLVASMVFLLFSSLALYIRKTIQWETTTRTSITQRSEIVFPSVTICSSCYYRATGNNTEFLQKLGTLGSHRSKKTDLFSQSEMEMYGNVSLDELNHKYGIQFDSHFIYNTFNGRKIESRHWQRQTPITGNCYTFNSLDYISKHRVWTSKNYASCAGGLVASILLPKEKCPSASMQGGVGLRIILSHPTQLPWYYNDGIGAHPGTLTRIALKYTEYSLLPKPYKAFQTEDCINVDEQEDKLVGKMVNASVYGYQTCLGQCVLKRLLQKCQCSMQNVFTGILPECTIKHVQCLAQSSDTLKKIKSLQRTCDCPRPCRFSEYGVTTSATQFPSLKARAKFMAELNETSGEALRNRLMSIKVYFDSFLIREEHHERAENLETFIGSVGGLMSLLLGVSIISIVELMEIMVDTVARRAKAFTRVFRRHK